MACLMPRHRRERGLLPLPVGERGSRTLFGQIPPPDAPQRVEDARKRAYGASTSPHGRGGKSLSRCLRLNRGER